jgi:hypothetical protein
VDVAVVVVPLAAAVEVVEVTVAVVVEAAEAVLLAERR